MTELPLQRLLLETIAVIDRLNIPYMLMGGFAVRTWAVPRPPYDADLAVKADEATLGNLLGALKQAGFDVPQEHEKGFRDVIAGMQKVKAPASKRDPFGRWISSWCKRGFWNPPCIAAVRAPSKDGPSG